jgi:uncharacterized Fe-S cluster-containing MiaB family protein
MNDSLIRADDVLEHYNRLKNHNPKAARITVFEGFGHNDFTYATHHSVSKEFRRTLKGYLHAQEISSLTQYLAECQESSEANEECDL